MDVQGIPIEGFSYIVSDLGCDARQVRWCVKYSQVLRESPKAVLISKWFDGGLKLCKEHGQITCPAPAEHR